MARRSTRGPCAAVSRGRQAAQREPTGRRFLFARAGGPFEKPGPGSRTCRAGMPGKRQVGWPSRWLSFSLLRASCPPPFGPTAPFAHVPDVRVATQEKSDSGRVSGSKALCPAVEPARKQCRHLSFDFASLRSGRTVEIGVRQVGRCIGSCRRRWTPAFAGVTAGGSVGFSRAPASHPPSTSSGHHRQGAPRLTRATPGSSAARTPPGPAIARRPQSRPAPAARWPDPWPWPRRLRPQHASARHAAG